MYLPLDFSSTSSYEEWEKPSTWDLRKILVDDTCRAKAGFVASQSAYASYKTRIAMALLILGFTIIQEFILFGLYCDDGPPTAGVNRRSSYSRTRRVGAFVFSSFCTTVVAVCFTVYVMAVQHQFYCEVDPNWHHWNREWIVAGFFPGVMALCSGLHWITTVVNVLLYAGNRKLYFYVPYYILSIPAIVALPFALVLGPPVFLLSRATACMERRRKRSREEQQRQVIVELAERRASERRSDRARDEAWTAENWIAIPPPAYDAEISSTHSAETMPPAYDAEFPGLQRAEAMPPAYC